jgi:type IV pilus assembly protein PilM
MNLLSGVSDFFGLDIDITTICLVQLRGNSQTKTLLKYAYVPIDSKLILSDSKVDQQKLASVIRDLVTQAKVSTSNVAVNLPSSRVFTTVVDMDRLPKDELGKSIRYQADSLIPTPVSESKIDWELLGDSPIDKNKVEILLSSVPNKFIEERLDLLESIGLNVIAFEPDNMALTRALVPADSVTPQMIIDVGYSTTDIVISLAGAPHLMRVLPMGTESLVRAAIQNLNIDEKQANQFVFKFGLDQNKLEGQIYRAIIGTIELLTAEIDKSIKFFETRYNNTKLERIIVTGGASILPEFPLYLANKFGLNVEIGNAWRNVSFAPDRQNELLAVSNQFSVAAGLAERQV